MPGKADARAITEVFAFLRELTRGFFKYFSTEERRARIKDSLDRKIRRAIEKEEQHYIRLERFLDFCDGHLKLKSSVDKKLYQSYKKRFSQDRSIFFKLT